MNALRIGPISFKVRGRDNTVEFIFDDASPVGIVNSELHQYLMDSDHRFEGAQVYTNFGRRLLNPSEAQSTLDILEHYGVNVSEISASQDLLEQAIAEPFSVPVVLDGHSSLRLGNSRNRQRPQTRIIRHSCRTGSSIQQLGDVVVMGNVNPGAEITATGDVIVMGALKGMVHAGADGNRDSVVIAISMEASQLRIANLIAIGYPQRIKNKVARGSEIAFIDDGAIRVKNYSGVLPGSAWVSKSIGGD
jgi:septum site-determining protein MinC